MYLYDVTISEVQSGIIEKTTEKRVFRKLLNIVFTIRIIIPIILLDKNEESRIFNSKIYLMYKQPSYKDLDKETLLLTHNTRIETTSKTF